MIVCDKGLNFSQVEALLYRGEKLGLAPQAVQRVTASYEFLKVFSKDKVIYGINTGFGPMAQYRVSNDSLTQLQYNIIRSHSAGAGEPLPPVMVKAAMIARLCTLLQGLSGVHIQAVTLLVELINRDICPKVPRHGSVGASGDLVQLAHIALAMIGEGEVWYEGAWQPAAQVLEANGLQPLEMFIREGLCLTNGTSVMTGIGLVNLLHAQRLIGWEALASALINEVARSYNDFLAPELNEAKRHHGQQVMAQQIAQWLEGSKCVRDRQSELYKNGHEQVAQFKAKVQPYYSLRCVPQVLGPIYDTVQQATQVVLNELNSASDNPIVDPQTENVYHGGNFHGDYVSFEMDKVKIALTKLTLLAERQMNYLFHDKINEILPPFVNLGTLGLDYGLQAAQFTATSTTAESQTLAMPNYIHSIPNNNDNQDIVSMGTNSALLTHTVIENAYQVLAIHFMALVQAVDCLKIQDLLAPKTRAVYQEIRSFLPVFVKDTPKYEQIATMVDYLKHKEVAPW